MATPAQKAAVEKKALAAAEDNKSAGLRLLFEAGYSVTDARTVLDVPYGFAYGVAKRAGVVDTAAERRNTKAEPKAKAAPKAKNAPTAKSTPVKTSKVAATKAAAAVKAAPVAKPARRTRKVAATA